MVTDMVAETEASNAMKRLLQAAALVLVLALPVPSSGLLAADPVTPCVGDCQGTGTDSIGSLVTLVSIALGNAPLASCARGVPSGAQVTVALIIQAVDNALHGCAEPQATPTLSVAAANTFTPTPTATVHAGRTPCPVGQHSVCHGGSGRGGGYRTICTCVSNPPPLCVTAWGTRIAAGTSVVLYDASTINAPDTCAAHGTLVSCDVHGVLDPPNAVGYSVCTVVNVGGGED